MLDDFQRIILPADVRGNTVSVDHKKFHLTLNALLHYLVNCEIVMQKTVTRLALELANNLLT